VLLGVVFNILSVVGVVMLNKQLVAKDGFDFIIFISTCHFFVTSIGTRVLLKMGFFQYKEAQVKNVLPVALGSLGSVAFMNLTLSHNSVGFYQISKLMCIPVTIFLQWLWYSQTTATQVLVTLIPILIGMAIATVTDVQINFMGTMYGCMGVLCTTCAQIFTSTFQKQLGCDALQLLYHTAPIIAVGMLLMIPIFDDLTAFQETELTAPVMLRLFLSCLFALGVNITNYLVLGKTGPLTYQVLGHFKTILIIVIGVTLFNKAINPWNLFGIAVALMGVIGYTETKRRVQSKIILQPLPVTIEATARNSQH